MGGGGIGGGPYKKMGVNFFLHLSRGHEGPSRWPPAIPSSITILDGMAPCYGHLLLAPAEGWWPSATWRALRALWIAVKKNWTPIFFIGGPPLYPPPHRRPPYPLHRIFLLLLLFFCFPHFFYRWPPPPIPPPPPPLPPLPLAHTGSVTNCVVCRDPFCCF